MKTSASTARLRRLGRLAQPAGAVEALIKPRRSVLQSQLRVFVLDDVLCGFLCVFATLRRGCTSRFGDRPVQCNPTALAHLAESGEKLRGAARARSKHITAFGSFLDQNPPHEPLG